MLHVVSWNRNVCFALCTTTVPESFKALKVELGHGKPCKQIWLHRKILKKKKGRQENIWEYLEQDESVQRCGQVILPVACFDDRLLNRAAGAKTTTETTRSLFTEFQGMPQKAEVTVKNLSSAYFIFKNINSFYVAET